MLSFNAWLCLALIVLSCALMGVRAYLRPDETWLSHGSAFFMGMAMVLAVTA